LSNNAQLFIKKAEQLAQLASQIVTPMDSNLINLPLLSVDRLWHFRIFQ